MLKARRKARLKRFSFKDNYLSVLLLAGLFACGFIISLAYGWPGIVVYLALWALSYGIIYAGTCRHCAYYGEKCPIPLEGSCVPRFFEKKDSGFGFMPLVWATLVYGLRVILPVYIIFEQSMVFAGVIYLLLFLAFWMVHLRFSGCPNCINTDCPLNPDYPEIHP
ncbi:MAG: hypothetical protein U5L07_06790 [Desulfobacterales bacterium]|nr:hypothetical protein [Desulfobacterales bacterium]